MKTMGGSFRGLVIIVLVGKGSEALGTTAVESAKKIVEYLSQDKSFIYLDRPSGDVINAITTDNSILEDATKKQGLSLVFGSFTDYFCVYTHAFNIEYNEKIE